MRLRDEHGWVRDRYFIGGLVGLVVLAGGLAFAFVAWGSSQTCGNRWADFEHRWELFGGCLVQHDGTWYPADDVLRVLLP